MRLRTLLLGICIGLTSFGVAEARDPRAQPVKASHHKVKQPKSGKYKAPKQGKFKTPKQKKYKKPKNHV